MKPDVDLRIDSRGGREWRGKMGAGLWLWRSSGETADCCSVGKAGAGASESVHPGAPYPRLAPAPHLC